MLKVDVKELNILLLLSRMLLVFVKDVYKSFNAAQE